MYHLGIFKIFSFSINLSWKFIYRRVLFQNFIPLSQKNISITLSKIVKIWIKTSTWKHLQLHTFIWEVQIKIYSRIFLFFLFFFRDIDKRRRISRWKKRRGEGCLSSSFFLTVIPAYTSCQLSRIIALTITRRFYCELSKLIARVIAFAAEVPPREIKARRFKRVHIVHWYLHPCILGSREIFQTSCCSPILDEYSSMNIFMNYRGIFNFLHIQNRFNYSLLLFELS